MTDDAKPDPSGPPAPRESGLAFLADQAEQLTRLLAGHMAGRDYLYKIVRAETGAPPVLTIAQTVGPAAGDPAVAAVPLGALPPDAVDHIVETMIAYEENRIFEIWHALGVTTDAAKKLIKTIHEQQKAAARARPHETDEPFPDVLPMSGPPGQPAARPGPPPK